jgi:hypothetical protein
MFIVQDFLYNSVLQSSGIGRQVVSNKKYLDVDYDQLNYSSF